jgi:hypothetical protein
MPDLAAFLLQDLAFLWNGVRSVDALMWVMCGGAGMTQQDRRSAVVQAIDALPVPVHVGVRLVLPVQNA